MYEYIRGRLVKKQAAQVVLDVQGVGWQIKTSLSTSEQLPEEGEELTLKTYLHVREDILQLYGFADDEERSIFLGLISISGVGPKLAQTILSGLSVQKLVQAVRDGDEKALNSISGVGKKTAQRLIVELQDKLPKISLPADGAGKETAAELDNIEDEALMALLSLGYSKVRAEKAVITAGKNKKALTVEELIKKALQSI